MPNLLTTTVIGSYTVPDWYPALQEAVTAGKLAPEAFRDAKAVATRAAIKDQEVANVDVVSDGELFRRDDNRFGGVKHAKKALHFCQGNYNPDPAAHVGIRIFPAEFAAILPVIQGANVDVVLMAFASLGVEDLTALHDFPQDKALGVGAIDVQTHRVETPEEVAQTIQHVATFIDPEHLWVNPDCGLNHLPRDVAFAKLRAMAAGTQIAKQQLVHA